MAARTMVRRFLVKKVARLYRLPPPSDPAMIGPRGRYRAGGGQPLRHASRQLGVANSGRMAPQG